MAPLPASGLVLCCIATSSCAGSPPPRAVTTVAVPPSPAPAQAEHRAPVEEHAVDADFDHRIRLVSYRVIPGDVAPGDEVVLTLSWERGAAIEAEWLFFVHVEDGPRIIFSDPNRVAAASCVLGALCTYEVRFRAPHHLSRLDVFAGLWRGADRMAILRGRADDDQRAVVGSIPRRLD